MTDEMMIARFRREYIDYHRITKERAGQQCRLLAEFGEGMETGGLATAVGDDLLSFAGDLLDRGLHVNTVRKKLNMIRSFYSWAYARGLISADQYLSLKSVRNPRGASATSTPKPYTRQELTEFWEAVDATFPLLPRRGEGSQALRRWRQGKGPWRRVWRHAMRLQLDAMVRLALDLGLRRHEIYGLSINDLHYDNAYIVIRGKADPTTGEPKERAVPFTTAARKAVKAWVEFRALMQPRDHRVWLSCHGNTYNKPMLESRFNKLLAQTLGSQWRWHRFRHTCATNWLRAGMKLEAVQRLLGHATLQQTLCYAEILKSDIARALARHEASFEEGVGRVAA
jgi:site-specific recombinase XerD